MASIGSVVVQFLADDKMSKTVGSITGKLRDLNKGTDDADSKMGKLSGTLKAGVAAGAAVAGGALLAAGGAMIDFAQAAIEDNKQAQKLADVLATIPGVTDGMIAANAEWIDSMELATAVADTELRDAVSKLALATGDLEQAQKLTTIAVDAAAGSGKNLSGIVDALAKAADGNTAALKRQFPWLDKNEDGTLTLTEAVDGLGGAYEGTAEAASNRDPWQKLKTVWDQLKESLGQWVLPLIEDFGEWFKDKKNQDAIKDIIDKVGDLARDMGKKLVPAVEDFLDWMGDPKAQQDLEEFADSVKTIADAVSNLIGKLMTLKSWIDKLPSNWILRKIGVLPDMSASSASAQSSSVGARSLATGPATVAAPPIFVTEDMVAQAVSSMVMRSEGRRGRLVMVS